MGFKFKQRLGIFKIFKHFLLQTANAQYILGKNSNTLFIRNLLSIRLLP